MDIAKKFSLFEKFAHFKLGIGNSIRLWEDPWIDQSPLKDSFPSIFANSRKQEDNCRLLGL